MIPVGGRIRVKYGIDSYGFHNSYGGKEGTILHDLTGGGLYLIQFEDDAGAEPGRKKVGVLRSDEIEELSSIDEEGFKYNFPHSPTIFRFGIRDPYEG